MKILPFWERRKDLLHFGNAGGSVPPERAGALQIGWRTLPAPEMMEKILVPTTFLLRLSLKKYVIRVFAFSKASEFHHCNYLKHGRRYPNSMCSAWIKLEVLSPFFQGFTLIFILPYVIKFNVYLQARNFVKSQA